MNITSERVEEIRAHWFRIDGMHVPGCSCGCLTCEYCVMRDLLAHIDQQSKTMEELLGRLKGSLGRASQVVGVSMLGIDEGSAADQVDAIGEEAQLLIKDNRCYAKAILRDLEYRRTEQKRLMDLANEYMGKYHRRFTAFEDMDRANETEEIHHFWAAAYDLMVECRKRGLTVVETKHLTKKQKERLPRGL